MSAPPGHFSLFNVYIALCFDAGYSCVQLLCDFEDTLFLRRYNAPLHHIRTQYASTM
jgi:hypothetical protein